MNDIQQPARLRLNCEDSLSPLPLRRSFGNDAPIEVDVGCGKGRFLLARAKDRPDINYLGIDRMLRRVRKVDRKAVRAGLHNIRLFRMEAYYAISYLIPPESISAYYVLFPDPWPKNDITIIAYLMSDLSRRYTAPCCRRPSSMCGLDPIVRLAHTARTMSKNKSALNLENLASLCKRRGFIFQSSELYGGINGFWDYGPLGVELKRNIKDAWWRDTVQRRDDVVGLDASIIMHPRIWEASGHLQGFCDPMVDCKTCKGRFRADQLDVTVCPKKPSKKVCDCGGELTEPRQFNLMFKTFVGPVEDDSSVAYLRPETAQGIFAQFDNVLSVSRQKIPFGIAQIGKAFRNEINPRNYTFRSREFEQMELEFFVPPGTDQEWHEYWVKERLAWYTRIGLAQDHLDQYVYGKDELAHYAGACVDIMYQFPFGLQELEGIAARGDYDLRRHSEYGGKKLEYFDQEKNERFIPHVVEPSAGVDRIALAVLCEAYRVEWIPKEGTEGNVREAAPDEIIPAGYEERTVLGFAPLIAPIKAAVFPLLKNRPEQVDAAQTLYRELQQRWPVFYDQTGAIGRRYRRQDEAGTPFGITVDFQTLEDQTVTWRDRDTMKQVRVPMAEVAGRLSDALA